MAFKFTSITYYKRQKRKLHTEKDKNKGHNNI